MVVHPTESRWVRLACLVVLLTLPVVVHGHGGPVPLAQWGNFPPDVVACQRATSHAASLCTAGSLQILAACAQSQLEGRSCDQGATLLAVSAVIRQAKNVVDQSCSDTQARAMGFLGSLELLSDLNTGCRSLSQGAINASYAPAMPTGTIEPVDAVTRACIEASANASAKVLQFGFEAWRRALDRIALQALPLSTKQALVDRASAQIGRFATRARASIARRCAPTDFFAAYQQSSASFLSPIANQPSCLAGLVYVQDAVACTSPTPTPTVSQ